MDSILISIKKLLGIPAEDTSFDADIIIHINTVFSILQQIGVGPRTGFSISDDTATWSEFVSDLSLLEMVKTYVLHKVRMQFDPPSNSTLMKAMENNIAELEWRMNAVVDYELKQTSTESKGDDDNG